MDHSRTAPPNHASALVSLVLVLFVAACGAPDAAPPSTPPPAVPVPGVPADPAPAATEERCEGLLLGCGVWSGCVLVAPDPTTRGRLVGIGPNAGHFYRESRECDASGICTEVCGGGSESVCRPGLVEEGPGVVCSGIAELRHAPFTCTLVSGACVEGPDPAMLPAS